MFFSPLAADRMMLTKYHDILFKCCDKNGAYNVVDFLFHRAYEDESTDGPSNWMDMWTIFYWGWWISWSPFVGTFIAKISKGRTIRQFVNGNTYYYYIVFAPLST